MVSIDDLLFEQTVLIPDPAAVSWKPYRGKRVEKTGSKATETAISKAGIVLYFPDLLEIVSQFPIVSSTTSNISRLIKLLPNALPIKNSIER